MLNDNTLFYNKGARTEEAKISEAKPTWSKAVCFLVSVLSRTCTLTNALSVTCMQRCIIRIASEVTPLATGLSGMKMGVSKFWGTGYLLSRR